MSTDYSVVIPAYNSALTIGGCLESVIAQTLPAREVIVIDDDSTDDTEAQVLRCERAFAAAAIVLKYVRVRPNAGPAAARNRGMRESKGAFIAFLDADDRWAAEKLAVVDTFARNSSAGLLFHGYSERREESAESHDQFAASRVPLHRLLLRNPAQTSCAVVRSSPWVNFDESMRRCEDYDLWMRIAEHSQVVRIEGRPLTMLGRPQLSAGGLSGDTRGMRAGEVRVYVNFCRRNWSCRAWLLPLLVVWSLLKHAYSWLRRTGRSLSAR